MTHLWNDRAKTQTVCGLGLSALGDGGEFASSTATDCPRCMPVDPLADTEKATAEQGKAWMNPNPREARALFLEQYRPVLVTYLKAKFEAEDWHGVQDAASDLRDLDSELDGLRY